MGAFGSPFSSLMSDRTLAALVTKVGTIDSEVANLVTATSGTSKPWLGAVFVDVPILGLNAEQGPFAITWAAPAPKDDYTITPAIFGLTTSQLQVTTSELTVTGCKVTLKAKAAILVSTAKVLLVAGRSAKQ